MAYLSDYTTIINIHVPISQPSSSVLILDITRTEQDRVDYRSTALGYLSNSTETGHGIV